MNELAKSSCVHGGDLADFSSGLTRSSFVPQCGQIYCSSTVRETSETPMSPSRYLATASRFLLSPIRSHKAVIADFNEAYRQSRLGGIAGTDK